MAEMRKGRVDSRFSINKASMLRCLVLLAVIGITSAVFAANDVANTVSVWDKIINFVKHYGYGLIVDVRGNAVWAFMVKIPLVSFILVVIGFSFFSQRLHVYLFLYGSWYGIPRFWGTAFGKIVSNSDTRLYRRFESPDRKKVIDAINAHRGVFLIMGPAGAGKSLMVRAESRTSHSSPNAKYEYVLAVDKDAWYDSRNDNPIKDILKERTLLLVKKLLWKKPVCIVLMWDSSPTTPVPSQDRMQKVIEELTGLLGECRSPRKVSRFRKVSFVLTVPAYYQIDSIRRDIRGLCDIPQEHMVNLLNCAECLSLLEAQIRHSLGNGVAADKCRSDLETMAERAGLTLDRMAWIESFGRPEQVVNIVSQHQYDSTEAWVALRDWWRQVYNVDGKNVEMDRWFSYLYVLALKSLLDDGMVNAEELADKMFGDGNSDIKRSIDEAIKRMCVNRRPLVGVRKEKDGALNTAVHLDTIWHQNSCSKIGTSSNVLLLRWEVSLHWETQRVVTSLNFRPRCVERWIAYLMSSKT